MWGPEYSYEKDMVHVHINHLRTNIEQDPKKPRYIINVSGIGYRFEIGMTKAS